MPVLISSLQGTELTLFKEVSRRFCEPDSRGQDGLNIFKDDWHPMNTWLARNSGKDELCLGRNRSEVGIKYYFIDFGLSTQFAPGKGERLVTGGFG
jgi:hypothetical protein